MTDLVPPPCPITGAPAKRLIQPVSVKLLRELWRWSFRTDASAAFGGIKRFHLWESPCGLAFFDPMRPGDAAFYRSFYANVAAHDRLSGERAHRPEMELAAQPVPEGGRVLDVGCGGGSFATYLPGRAYVGLDPFFAEDAPPGRDIRAETVAQHAAKHAATYDAAVALQVIEHVADPLGVVREMAVCLKPGGVLVIGVPSWPSTLTAIPNFVMNAPPHHLSWWNETSLRALATRLGLSVEAVQPVPVARAGGIICWMARLAPRAPDGRFFVAGWRYYLGLGWAYAAGWLLDRLFGIPRNVRPHDIMLVARKPG